MLKLIYQLGKAILALGVEGGEACRGRASRVTRGGSRLFFRRGDSGKSHEQSGDRAAPALICATPVSSAKILVAAPMVMRRESDTVGENDQKQVVPDQMTRQVSSWQLIMEQLIAFSCIDAIRSAFY